MANTKGSTSIRNSFQNSKSSLLPPKIPFPSVTPSYSDYSSNANLRFASKYRDGNVHHQRTSSESFIEEQPTWLDDLLDEPETPVRKGHRRSSSDSFAYIDAANMYKIDNVSVSHGENKFRPTVSSPLWGSQTFELSKETRQGSPYIDPNYYVKAKNRAWESKLSPPAQPIGKPSSGDNSIPQRPGSPLEADALPSTAVQKQDHGESASHDPKSSSEKKDGSHSKNSTENDTKRAKQQFAQRSRVRKLQYIAELERNVQALQAEGSEVTAELEFLNQQNLILSLENKALKQRLESVAQEKLIKYLEHEVLEREIGRLRSMYQQQQQQLQQQQQQHQPQQRQTSSGHRRINSRDLDSQFANLNLKQEASSCSDSITGPIRI